MNGVLEFTADELAGVTKIDVRTGEGDDTVILGKRIDLPARVDAGPGDDLVGGGNGNDVLVGGAGNRHPRRQMPASRRSTAATATTCCTRGRARTSTSASAESPAC